VHATGGHGHHWDSLEQDRWARSTQQALLEALPIQALTKPLEARTVTPITLTDTSAFITALEQDRTTYTEDHRQATALVEKAFERGWDAHRESTRAQVQQILNQLDGLHANDGMPYAQYSQLHDLASALNA
jgi:hypothetical protein